MTLDSLHCVQWLRYDFFALAWSLPEAFGHTQRWWPAEHASRGLRSLAFLFSGDSLHWRTAKTGSGLRFERSEGHTSELQSLMRISYAVFCLKKKKTHSHQLILHRSLDIF